VYDTPHLGLMEQLPAYAAIDPLCAFGGRATRLP
jgi:hypothetical protein